MRLFAAIVCFFALTYSASAQQQSPETQALAQKLMAEINANISCSTAGIAMKQRLDVVESELKALKDKHEKPEEKKP